MENSLACACIARGRCCVCDGYGKHRSGGHWYCLECYADPEGDEIATEPSLEELRERELTIEEESA